MSTPGRNPRARDAAALAPVISGTGDSKVTAIVRFFPHLYDIVMSVAERGRLGRWRRSVVSPAQGRILEIGAGTGLDFPHYGAGVTVIATEPDVAMLARARVRARAASATILLVAADTQALPFRAHTFDTGIVGLALCTIPHPNRALAELRRVLRNGGSLRLLEHVRSAQPVIARLQDWLTPFWRRVAGGCRLNRRTTDTVAASGFVMRSVIPHAGGLVVEIVATPAREPGRSARVLPDIKCGVALQTTGAADGIFSGAGGRRVADARIPQTVKAVARLDPSTEREP